jgi:hypothetical protein
LVIRYRTRLAACQRPFAVRCALAVAATCVVPPLNAGAQRAESAIEVSLVIAPTVELRTVAITERRLDRRAIPARPTASPPIGRAVVTSRTAPVVLLRSELRVPAGT